MWSLFSETLGTFWWNFILNGCIDMVIRTCASFLRPSCIKFCILEPYHNYFALGVRIGALLIYLFYIGKFKITCTRMIFCLIVTIQCCRIPSFPAVDHITVWVKKNLHLGFSANFLSAAENFKPWFYTHVVHLFLVLNYRMDLDCTQTWPHSIVVVS